MRIVGVGGLGPSEKRESIDRFAADFSGDSKPRVLVIPTPKAKPETMTDVLQKSHDYYTNLGMFMESLYVEFDRPPSRAEIEEKIGAASMIHVTGGDTLRAMERFNKWGIDEDLKQAAEDNKVLSGVSAGAIIWFSQGHSDSLSYRVEAGQAWDYIFVDGLKFQPGTICPHYNSMTEGGEPRKISLAKMILEREEPITEPVYGIDNRAAIVVDGENIASITADYDQRVHVIDPSTGQTLGQLDVIS